MLILIIEDDAGITELLQEKLRERGYKTDSVQSAGAALAYLEAHSPDLMVLDFSLPDMDGDALIRELQTKAQPLPPFIVATGQAMSVSPLT